MTFLTELYSFPEDDEQIDRLPAILDGQVSQHALGVSSKQLPANKEWSKEKRKLESLLNDTSADSTGKAMKIIAKLVETLELYSPSLKGLQGVHAYICERLENLIFDQRVSKTYVYAAAFLYGESMALSVLTSEAVALAVENLLLRGNVSDADISLCILLGVEQSNPDVFENNLEPLLRQVQIAAFNSKDKRICREALKKAMELYAPSERASSCQHILRATHTLLSAALTLSVSREKALEGVIWTCFIIEHTPMQLRLDLRRQYPQTCNAVAMFESLQTSFDRCSTEAQAALCGALAVLTTWDTPAFVNGVQVGRIVDFMFNLPPESRVESFRGLGQLASVILDRFALYLDLVAPVALETVKVETDPRLRGAAQKLLGHLLAALGPITTNFMIDYLHCEPHILLTDVRLLEMIATLLPNLASRIMTILVEVIDKLMLGIHCKYKAEDVLIALNYFPLDEPLLAERAHCFVLWSLDEEKGRDVVMSALDLVTEPNIATKGKMHLLTFKAAQLLLAEDPFIVHFALNKLSNPILASTLDERSCRMILLALHQSLEPSIQVVAAKLLTHLAANHQAIVQPLAWSHIRQSFSLMDFLKTVNPTRAVIEACIISNLLPALPSSLHRKYVTPVKELILSGLERPKEGHLISLIFQGLANLAKFEGWAASQQAELATGLLEMTQEIPKDSQHAALNAISRLLAVPQDGLDVYHLLTSVHATFSGRNAKLDPDLKSLVSGIYGHLGTVERNPMISRDSRAAIMREEAFYTPKTVSITQVAEIRDKCSADNQTHVNWLVTKTLLGGLATAHKAGDERSLMLEMMISLGILQPQGIAMLIPDLPTLILRELRSVLENKEHSPKDATNLAIGIFFLSSALHTSPVWLQLYWPEVADVFAQSITFGERLPVLKALDVVLNVITD